MLKSVELDTYCDTGAALGISRAEHAAAPGNNLNAVRFLFAFNIDTYRNYFQRSPFSVKDWLVLQSILTIHLPLCIHPMVLHQPTHSPFHISISVCISYLNMFSMHGTEAT